MIETTHSDPVDAKKRIRALIGRLSERDLYAVQRFIEYLAARENEHPAIQALRNAPEVELTGDERALLDDARERDARGETEYVSHDEARRLLLGDEA